MTMLKTLLNSACALATIGLIGPARADDYALDPAHAGFTFKIQHLGISWTYGRFNACEGTVRIGPDPANASFTLQIKTDSLDTGNQQRDDHLRSPDWFNSKQFPLITFKSTAVKPTASGYEVTGDLTLHGVTKSVVLAVEGGGKAEFPKGVQRIGYTTNVVLKRSEFGMTTMVGPVGDDVYLSISFEGIKK
jgi:polyisoprenoid-binding protein YceI